MKAARLVRAARNAGGGPALGRWAGCLGLGLLGLRATAQVPSGTLLKFTPQYLVLSGLWLEAERARAGHPN